MQLWLEIRSSARDARIQLRCPIEEQKKNRNVVVHMHDVCSMCLLSVDAALR